MKVDYILTTGNEKVLLETEQRKTRLEVIAKYKECRKSQGITQVELARRTGISQPNITRFESGNYNPSLDMMVRIAAALGMSLDINFAERS